MAGGKDKKKPPDQRRSGGDNAPDSQRGNARDVGVQVSPSDFPKPSRRCSIKRVVFYSIFAALLAVGVASYLKHLLHMQMLQEMMIMNLGPDAFTTFSSYDRDQDGYLSMGEFEPLVAKLGTGDETLVGLVIVL